MQVLKHSLISALLLTGIAHATAAWAISCSGGGPKPDWVDTPETVTEDYFYAAGVSDDPKASLSERIATAKQNALKGLSEEIEVSVKNSLILEQSSRTTGGQELTDSNLQSITSTSTNASLRNVEAVATWEDPKTCLLWLRARVSKKDVERGKREGLSKTLYASFKGALAQVQNEQETLNNRLLALDAAVEVLPRISFEFLPDANSADYYKQLLSRYQKELQHKRSELEQARNDLNEADLLVSKAASQTSESDKAKSLTTAAGIYRTLLAAHSEGMPPLFEAGDILYRLGELETVRRSNCGAKSYFQQAGDSKQLNDRREIARKKAESLACSAEDMEKTLWRQYFEGRSVVLACQFQAGGEQGAWSKPCDGLNNLLRPLGAEVSVQTLTAAQLQALQKGEVPAGMGQSGKLILVALAQGKMNTHPSPDAAGRREYQFEGNLSTVLIENGNAVYSDRFQGTTGWNPISAEMVMDVLGLNVTKRWQGKFSKFLKHELN